MPERFVPGSLITSDVVLNVQHERSRPIARTGAGLLLKDGPESLQMTALLPETTEARDTLTLVSSGVLRGLSVEFETVAEHEENGVRVIDMANLSGLAVCDRPAYPGSTVEARAKGRAISGKIPYNQTETIANSGRVRKSRIAPGAFSYSIDDEEQEIIAQIGTAPSQILASKKAGSLRLADNPTALTVEIDNVVSTVYADDFLKQLASGQFALGVRPLYRIEGVENAFSDSPEPGNPSVKIRTVENAVLYAVSFVHRKRKGDSSRVEKRERRALWL